MVPNWDRAPYGQPGRLRAARTSRHGTRIRHRVVMFRTLPRCRVVACAAVSAVEPAEAAAAAACCSPGGWSAAHRGGPNWETAPPDYVRAFRVMELANRERAVPDGRRRRTGPALCVSPEGGACLAKRADPRRSAAFLMSAHCLVNGHGQRRKEGVCVERHKFGIDGGAR